MATYHTAKDEIMIRPGRASLELLFYMVQSVLSEVLVSERGERDAAAAHLHQKLWLHKLQHRG
jgi:hypothetical protein